MARNNRRRTLKHLVHKAIDERKKTANTQVLALAFQQNRDAESLFILRCFQAIITHQNSQPELSESQVDPIDDFEANRPFYTLLLGALEYHLTRSRSLQLVLLGRRLRQISEHEIHRLEEALKILTSTRYVQDRPSRERKGLRNAAFPLRIRDRGRSFVSIARMTEAQFLNLVVKIAGSKVFQNDSNNPQKPVAWQLLVALANLGSSGNGGDHSHIAYTFHISEGSVHNWTNRCIYAILQLEKDWVHWPNEEERQELKSAMVTSIFKDTVGFMDGTLIPLAFAPVTNREDYWTRKFFYAFNIMLVGDINRKIRFYELGWCGCAHDQRVFRTSLDPSQFLDADEYILADSGYTVSRSVITPFKRQRGEPHRPEEDSFNMELSKWRVIIEQTIGMLKGRFQSLKELRILIHGRRSVQRANAWIRACIILHNYTTSEGESWHMEFGTIDEGLNHIGRQARPPQNRPAAQPAPATYETGRDESRRDQIFRDFVARRSENL